MNRISANKYLTLFFLFIVIQSGFANQVEDLMKKGNDYYQNKDYGKAIESYQKLVDDGYEGLSLFYNLGNSYYRTDKIGLAIVNYERALKISPGDEDVQYNLAIANAKTIDNIETLPKFFLFQWWESTLTLFSVKGWTYIAYGFYFLILILIGVYFFTKRPGVQRYSFFGGLVVVVFFILSAILLTVNLNRELNIKQGVVVQQAVSVKLSPDSKSNDAFVIHEGLKVQIEDKVDNWIKIRLHDGKVGWLPATDVANI